MRWVLLGLPASRFGKSDDIRSVSLFLHSLQCDTIFRTTAPFLAKACIVFLVHTKLWKRFGICIKRERRRKV